MKGGAENLVLLGDPRQLPAVVVSEKCKSGEYGRSLMERLMNLGVESVLLDIQYRMHPEISSFPSLEFYQDRLRDHWSVKSPPSVRMPERALTGGDAETPWPHPDFPPYLFINVAGPEVANQASSLRNEAEADLVLFLISRFRRQFKGFNGSIGVISPYGHQVRGWKGLLLVVRGT